MRFKCEFTLTKVAFNKHFSSLSMFVENFNGAPCRNTHRCTSTAIAANYFCFFAHILKEARIFRKEK